MHLFWMIFGVRLLIRASFIGTITADWSNTLENNCHQCGNFKSGFTIAPIGQKYLSCYLHWLTDTYTGSAISDLTPISTLWSSISRVFLIMPWNATKVNILATSFPPRFGLHSFWMPPLGPRLSRWWKLNVRICLLKMPQKSHSQ